MPHHGTQGNSRVAWVREAAINRKSDTETRLNIGPNDALLVVDVQNDFCPGGNAAVEDGDAVARKMSDVALNFRSRDGRVFATQDWHPTTHKSFAENGGIWPAHCVRGTEGAGFHEELKLPVGASIIRKGQEAQTDAYSGFDGTTLEVHLERLGIRRVFVGGLSTEYAVQHTVYDALQKGYSAFVITDAVSAVNANPDDDQRALDSMLSSGAKPITTTELLEN